MYKFENCISLDCSILILDETRILRRITYAVCGILVFRSFSLLRASRYCKEKYVGIAPRPREMIMRGYSCITIFSPSGKMLAMHMPDGACIDGLYRACLCRAKCMQRGEWCLLSYGPFSLVRSLRICIKITVLWLRHTDDARLA